jgi:hypothetical protein
MRKKGVLQLALQFNFWVAEDIYNSLYLYAMNANGQVTTHHIYDAIHCNSFSAIMQFHYNCTHDVMLMSLIIIHLLKFDTWHYAFF